MLNGILVAGLIGTTVGFLNFLISGRTRLRRFRTISPRSPEDEAGASFTLPRR
ncbi:hypothetical protein ACPOL_3767 [Acidisarcina polymorpha]|uniref:Uncharacterized protein n=1 Tax=Acidisarcina polymorpha TaxID=2211140 RepID=A0A2Z5G3E1_9BACT|nr:hypothetical protein ACPOL_3767 [Acidisarcina polymorpha]